MRWQTTASWLLVLLLPAQALAGNLESFFQGDEAALSGGAVVAITQDVGAVWYNPAGLGANQRSKLDLSGSAFVLRLRRIPDGVVVALPDRTLAQDTAGEQLITVPTAVGFVRALGDGVSLGVGVFVSEQDFLTLTGNISDSRDGGSALTQVAETTTGTARYHAGPAVGWQVSETVRLGASLFGVYETVEHRRYFVTDILLPDGSEADRFSALGQVTTRPVRFALEMCVGLQWQPHHDLQLGLAVHTPRLLLHAIDDVTDLTLVTASGPNVAPLHLFDRGVTEVLGDDSVLLTAGRIVAGFSWSFGRGWVAAEGELSPGLHTDRVDRAPVWNVRAGMVYGLSDTLRVGGGLFSDHSPAPEEQDLFATEVDYYGLSLGAELRTRVPLGDAEAGGPSTLLFASTFALRYAIGLGQVRSVLFDFSELPTTFAGVDTGPHRRDVTFHEISLHIGQALFF